MNETKINHGYYSATIRSYPNESTDHSWVPDFAGYISVCDTVERREIMIKLTRKNIDEIVRGLQDHVSDHFPIIHH